jgi:secreted trypsin-like serine protease
MNKTGNSHFRCGGSWLNEQWIITSGNCLASLETEPHILLLDGHDYTEPKNYKLIKYERIVIHPEYKEFSGHQEFSTHDIALIKLARSTRKLKSGGDRVVPRLPVQGASLRPNTICYITGYGASSEIDNDAEIKRIKEGKVAIKLDQICIRSLGLIYYDNSTMICAGRSSSSHSSTTCLGDAGGPLVCQGSFGNSSDMDQWYLFGITSFGALDCVHHHNSVFTKVAMYVSWIEDTMDLYKDCSLGSEEECRGTRRSISVQNESASQTVKEPYRYKVVVVVVVFAAVVLIGVVIVVVGRDDD